MERNELFEQRPKKRRRSSSAVFLSSFLIFSLQATGSCGFLRVNAFTSPQSSQRQNSITNSRIRRYKGHNEKKIVLFRLLLSQDEDSGNSPLEILSKDGPSALAQQGKGAVQSAATYLSSLGNQSTKRIESISSNVQSVATELVNRTSQMAESTSSSLTGLLQQTTATSSSVRQWMDQNELRLDQGTNKAKEAVLQFTGKKRYEFGDISREVLQRATMATKNVNIRDFILLLKVLIALGATVTPLAKILPVTVLLEALNMSLENRIGAKVLEFLASALDERLLAAFSADELGEATKRWIEVGLAAFTGKETFEKGDIEQAVQNRVVNATAVPSAIAASPQPRTLNLLVGPEFLEWDESFRGRQTSSSVDEVVDQRLNSTKSSDDIMFTRSTPTNSNALDREFVKELEQWDEDFLSRPPEEKQQQ